MPVFFTIFVIRKFFCEGIPGIKASLLEEFGVRMITYDLPGFGESDPHPSRNLNSSAMDVQDLANALGVKDKFWVFGYSSAAMHAWAAIKYMSDRVAGKISQKHPSFSSVLSF